MGWKNFSVQAKLFVGFGIVLALLMVIGIVGYNGIDSVTKNAKGVIIGRQLDGLLAQKEVDHLNWIGKVNKLWTASQDRKIDVQTDDHKCEFGQWLYGQGRKDLETSYPDMADLLKKIETPHKQLHSSVIEINQIMGSHTEKSAGLAIAGGVLNKKTLPALDQVRQILHDIRKSATHRIMTDEIMFDKARRTSRYIIIMTAITILVGVLLAMLISASISRPAAQVVTFVKQLPQGDFKQILSINQEDEIGQLVNSLNFLVPNLEKMFLEVKNGIVTLSASSTELGTISEQMKQDKMLS